MSDIKIKELRGKLGISQEKLGEMLGVHLRTIQNWEKGGIIPKTKHEILRNLEYTVKAEMHSREILAKIIEYRKTNYNQLANDLNLKRSQNLYDIRDGKIAISGKLAQKIINLMPEISLTWLLSGEGSMLKEIEPQPTEITPDKELELLRELHDKNKKIEQLEQENILLKTKLKFTELKKNAKAAMEIPSGFEEDIITVKKKKREDDIMPLHTGKMKAGKRKQSDVS